MALPQLSYSPKLLLSISAKNACGPFTPARDFIRGLRCPGPGSQWHLATQRSAREVSGIGCARSTTIGASATTGQWPHILSMSFAHKTSSASGIKGSGRVRQRDVDVALFCFVLREAGRPLPQDGAPRNVLHRGPGHDNVHAVLHPHPPSKAQ
jgi:hypothetical protein